VTEVDAIDRLVREAVRDGIQKFVSGAVVHSEGRVLLVRRSAADDFLPGREELPSGGVDEGESIEEGRTRELHEEIGLGEHRVDDEFIGLFDYRDGQGRSTRQFTFSIPWPGGEPRLSHEHSSYRWIGLEELEAVDVTSETKALLLRWWAWHAS
jgi:8-oxo-dGTP diphosphatase